MAVGCARQAEPARPGAPGPLLVTCGNVIGSVRSVAGQRTVLGSVAVPPAFLAKPVAATDSGWGYWHKAGLAVYAGRGPLTVTVPGAWRGRAAITWGNGLGIVSELVIARCPSPAGYWNAYAGGVYLRSSAACVPLVFRVGSRAQTVSFGIGRRCF